MSVLIKLLVLNWIQTVCHSDSDPERSIMKKRQQMTTKHENYPAYIELAWVKVQNFQNPELFQIKS